MGSDFQGSNDDEGAIDRLVHHATILEFNGESVRGQQARGRQKGQTDRPGVVPFDPTGDTSAKPIGL